MSLINLKNSNLKAIVDDDLLEYLSQWKWKLTSQGYVGRAERSLGNLRIIMLHRTVNQTPESLLTDHINHNKLDNRRINLRTVTSTQNMANRLINSNNKSGYKGVHFNKNAQRVKRWCAAISNNGKVMTIGNYHTPEEAAIAYDCAAIQLRGEFAKLNTLGESSLVS